MAPALLGTDELAKLRADAEATMGDLVAIGVNFPQSIGAEGQVDRWQYDATSIAGFRELGPAQLSRRGMDLSVTGAELRLPVNAWVDSRVRIKLLERAGQPVSPAFYKVLGNATRGHSAAVLTLQQIEGGQTGE